MVLLKPWKLALLIKFSIVLFSVNEIHAQKIYLPSDTLELGVGFSSIPSHLDSLTGDLIREGEYKYYYDEKKKKKKYISNFKNGQLNGRFLAFHENNKIKAEINFINGKKNGECSVYYPNGTLKYKINYINGLFNGQFIEYYKNGRVKRKLNFINSFFDGKCSAYNDDKKNSLLAEGEYNLGQRNGTYNLFTSKESKIVEKFKNGIPISNKLYYQNEQLVLEYVLNLESHRYIEIITYKKGIKSTVAIPELLSDDFIYGKYIEIR